MTLSEEQFLYLLRAGLWGRACGAFPVAALGRLSVGEDSVPDWQGILRLARQQGVLLLVQDGLEVLLEAEPQWAQEGKALPPMHLLKLQRFRGKTAKAHAELEDLMGEILAALSADGLHPVVLKGEPLSTYYLHPESRSCGDIDLWVPPQEWKRAASCLSERLEDGERNNRHRAYSSGANEVELHFQALELENPFRQRAFRRYSEQELKENTRPCALPLTGLKLQVPSEGFNALFILAHAFHHFIEGGVGLRQLCDWVRVLEHSSWDAAALAALQDQLRQFALTKAWQVFGFIAVQFLGLPKEKLPFYNPRAVKDAAKVLALILSEGNFGRYGKGKLGKDAEEGYLSKKNKSLRLGFRRLFAKSSIFPSETIFYLPRWAAQAFRRLRRGK